MKEVLRILHGQQEHEKHNMLRDFNLSVYEGDILYVQGLSGSGVSAFIKLLDGKDYLDEGSIFVDEKKISNEWIKQHGIPGIWVITEGENLVENLTVTENLKVIQKKKNLFSFYHNKRAGEEVKAYLEAENIHISEKSLVGSLSTEERQKLSILKANLLGAKVIVLDSTKGYFEGKNADEVTKLILKLRERGSSFIIVSEQIDVFATVANRIQIISHGRDLMEWNYFERGVFGDAVQKIESFRQQQLIGYYDYEWDSSRDIWEYFKRVANDNTGFWEQYIGKPPLEYGRYSGEGVVLIPKDSAEQVLDNMSIKDNIILPVPKRIGRGPVKYISQKLADNISKDFFKLIGKEEEEKMEQLTYVERKVLSIYRWEIAKPTEIILENPYWGMDLKDTEAFQKYIQHLIEKGIKIIFFSKSLEELKSYCGQIIITENAQNARLNISPFD